MIHFSYREEKILSIIGDKRLTLEEISQSLFEIEDNAPFEPEITVANSIRRIIKKCDYHKLKWTLKKDRNGRKLLISRIKR